MQPDIPAELEPLFEAWIVALTPLGDRIHGVYLYGSLALGEWNPAASDIDAVVLTTGDWSSGEMEALRDVHAGLTRTYPLAARLKAMYVPFEHLGQANGATPPYPAFRDGEFLATTHGDVNAVTCRRVYRDGGGHCWWRPSD